MSSYYPSFSYMGVNSLKDKNLMVVSFSPNQGEADTFLGMDCIYTEKYDGSRRLDYGAKFNSTAVIKIELMKANKKDFTVAEVRDFLRWTTGIRRNSYLDLLIGNQVKFSFLGRVTNAYQQKLDARTVGLSIEFTSVSPWAYSPIQYVNYSTNQSMSVNTDGVVYKTESLKSFNVNSNGVVYDDTVLGITSEGIVHINNSSIIRIDNKTDDLYTPVYLNVEFINDDSDALSIKNVTLNEETIINGLSDNEVITLSENQFILSDKPEKIFGNDFNFIWPKLGPGINEFIVEANGDGKFEFSYRYPIKIGDCAIDIDAIDGVCGDYSDDESSGGASGTISGKVPWSNVTNTPSTLAGYGIKNAYTKAEIDSKMENIECDCGDIDVSIDEQKLNDMLTDIFGS